MAHITRSSAKSRRTLTGLGAVGIVAGTFALTAGLSVPAANAATISLKYHCTASVFGADLDQGTWTAAVTVGLPNTVNIGDAIPAPKVTAKVTTSAASGDTMRGLGVKSVDGTSDAAYTFGSTKATAKLTIPSTPVPASGPVVTTASGNGAAATAPSTPGDIPVTIGDFSGTLNAHPSTGPALGLGLTCTLLPGQNTQIGVVHVVDPSAPTSTPTSPTSTPTVTGTPTATTTSTATGTTSSTGVTGPPIITDGGSSDGGLNGGVLGGAAVAAAGVGALGFGLRRRLSNK